MKKLIVCFIAAFFVLTGQAFAEVNINTATQDELEALQGIGPAKARAIIEYREKNGVFNSVDSLIGVDGIGQGTMNQLRDSITVGSVSDSAAAAVMAQQE